MSENQSQSDTGAHPYLSHPPHYLTFEDVIDQLGSNADNGLTTSEVKERLEKYGENMLEGGESVSFAKIFIRQIANAMMLVRVSDIKVWTYLLIST